MKANATRSWYREPWPWILMAGPVIVIVAGIITAWLAFSGADGLVDDDYYKQGLAVNQRMQRDAEATLRGLAADIVLSRDGRTLDVVLNERAATGMPPQVSLHLSHPTRSGFDQHVDLKIGSDLRYHGTLSARLFGRWYLTLDDASRRWRLAGEWNLDAGSGVSLLAKRVSSTAGER